MVPLRAGSCQDFMFCFERGFGEDQQSEQWSYQTDFMQRMPSSHHIFVVAPHIRSRSHHAISTSSGSSLQILSVADASLETEHRMQT